VSSASRRRWAARAALAVILAVAAWLRFTGLGWGLRHPPHMDERVFVESVFEMMRAGDLDHRYYEYPGLVFYLLWPLLRPLLDGGPGPTAYLVARGLVAAFGVIGCAALYPLGRRLHSEAAGLLAAALMAVSLVAVETAHMFRPDVVLQALCALALLAFARLDGGRRAEVAAGALLGLALASKFSGVFLVPSYLAARWLAPGPRWRRLALGALTAGLCFAMASPYAIVHARDFLEGVQVQLRYHYEEQVRESVGYGAMLLEYARVWVNGLGSVGAILALAGLETAVRDWRKWLPSLLLVVVSFAVLATSDVRHERFLLAALSVGCLLAGAGAARIAELLKGRLRVPAAATLPLLAVAMTALPLRASAWFAREMTEPLTRDLVLDWVAASVPGRARVVCSVPQLGLDPERLDVLLLPRILPENRAQVLEADVVLSTSLDPPEAVAGLQPLFSAAPDSKYQGRSTVTAWSVPRALRPAHRPLELAPRWLSASASAADLPAALDGRLDTLWRTPGPQRRGDWLAVTLPAPALLSRVELVLGPEARFAARQLRVEVSEDGREWRPADALPGRAPVELQPPGGEYSQVLLLSPPRLARALRLVQTGLGWRRRWGLAELRLWELPAGQSTAK
jgi:4-amino-4-deoxy-L-arabinose transferase-like glycosyltransferase